MGRPNLTSSIWHCMHKQKGAKFNSCLYSDSREVTSRQAMHAPHNDSVTLNILCYVLLLVSCCRATGQQYWWERFPANAGRSTTAYMFAFTDPAPCQANLLQQMLDAYTSLLPTYLATSSSDSRRATGSSGSSEPAPAVAAQSAEAGESGSPHPLDFQRLVVGFVPCYGERVLPVVGRVLPVGDAAGNRSALSLAGFCALVRHLPRVVGGVREALAAGALGREDLALLQPYSPGVDAGTAMQRSMAVHSNQLEEILGKGGKEPVGERVVSGRGERRWGWG